jgi:hypothetical protein
MFALYIEVHESRPTLRQVQVNVKANLQTAGYTRGHRAYEWGCIALAAVSALLFLTATLVALRQGRCGWSLASWLSIPLAILFADAVSGLVHWAFDRFGDAATFLLGPLAIRTFREHHETPNAMSTHDWLETNGHNIGLAIVLSGSGTWHVWHHGVDGGAVFYALSCIVVSVTSQLHKWAHSEVCPGWVRLLQRLGLILSPESHALHHAPPYERHYFVATGWLNRPAAALHIFPILEWLISAPRWALAFILRRMRMRARG